MRYTWDNAKAESNRSKHGVSFERLESMFANALIFEDLDHSEEEDRYIAIGFDDKGRLLTAAFTRPDDETIRFISARPANKSESEVYANARREA